MATWIYTIPLPPDTDAEEFAGRFAAIDLEGIEERPTEICLYLDEAQAEAGESYIREICGEQGLTFTRSPLEHKNWNEAWEKSFQPVQVGDFVYIRAGFHPPREGATHEIVIDPKMSFGTGHHPTTFQVMQAMKYLDLSGREVLDCGSGTGILAILAEKCGASRVVALDNDPWCFENVRENIALNRAARIEPVLGELDALPDAQFGVVLANIHRNYLLEHLERLSGLLEPGGMLLMSGFYGTDARVLLDKALEQKLIANYYSEQHHWACLVLEKK